MWSRVILASQSPRRRELLKDLMEDFEIMPARGAEISDADDPAEYVMDLARGKAGEIADKLAEHSAGTSEVQSSTLIIGADTVVVRGNEILGKPKNAEDAYHMLHELQGATHQVYTGVSLVAIDADGSRRERHFAEKTDVTFGPMNEHEIKAYIATRDPMDKAGAYGIQSGAAKYISHINGDYNNVVGLPVARLYQELKRFERELVEEAVKKTVDAAPDSPAVASARPIVEAADAREADPRPQYAAEERRLDQQFAFLKELDMEKFIGRQTYLTGAVRKENDAEHAWHMAVMAMILKEYAEPDLDLLRTICMILLHDVVEIDAGDTYAYDPEGKTTQEARELKAADRIFSILPEDQAKRIRGLWDEFEAWETPEAKFAHACDNFQPLMLNRVTHGQSWRENGIHLSQVIGRNARSAEGAPDVWQYAYTHFIEPSLEDGALEDDVHIMQTF